MRLVAWKFPDILSSGAIIFLDYVELLIGIKKQFFILTLSTFLIGCVSIWVNTVSKLQDLS